MHDRQQPVPKLELSANRITLLLGYERSKMLVVLRIRSECRWRGNQRVEGGYGVGERGNEGRVKREVGEVS